MFQKTIFYFENQVVKDMKTMQAHNLENMENLKKMQSEYSAHMKTINNAGVGKQSVTCKYCKKPGHVSEQCFSNPRIHPTTQAR